MRFPRLNRLSSPCLTAPTLPAFLHRQGVGTSQSRAARGEESSECCDELLGGNWKAQGCTRRGSAEEMCAALPQKQASGVQRWEPLHISAPITVKIMSCFEDSWLWRGYNFWSATLSFPVLSFIPP